MSRSLQLWLRVALTLGLLAAPHASPAQPARPWFDLHVPGSIARIAEGAGLSAEPSEGPGLVRDLIQAFQRDGREAREAAVAFRDYLEDLQLMRTRWRAVTELSGEVNLAAAEQEPSRRALDEFLQVVGLSLTRQNGAYRVIEGSPGGWRRLWGRPRRPLGADDTLAAEGIVPGDVMTRLNRGESIPFDVPRFVVSLPLSPRLWLELLLRETVADGDAGERAEAMSGALLARLVTESGPATLFSGLAALDAATLEFLHERPRTLARLYGQHLATFGRCARSIRVDDGQMRVPGGAEARPLWESLVGASVTEPARFVDRLLGRESGRLAYFYDTMAQLPTRQQRFALGLWHPDNDARERSFASLWRVFRQLPLPAQLPDLPDDLRPLDAAIVLRAVSVDASGEPRWPASRDFWTRVFEDDRIPDDPARETRELEATPSIDAAWTLVAALSLPRDTGRSRLHAFSFAQRVFHGSDTAHMPSVFVAARAFARFPTLMLSIERMGIRDADVFVSLANAAAHFDSIGNPIGLRLALSQFQAAIALVERCRRVGALSVAEAADVLTALASLRPARAGNYDGAVAGWLVDRLLASLTVTTTPTLDSTATEDRLLGILAGAPRPGDARAAPVIEWEGLEYVVDRSVVALERFRRLWDRQRGNRLDAVLALWTEALEPARAIDAIEQLPALIEVLEGSTARISDPELAFRLSNSRRITYVAQLRPILDDLRDITDLDDLRRLPRITSRLGQILDLLMADVLLTLTYTVHLAHAEGSELIGDDVAARHDFGVGASRRTLAQAPWSPPADRYTDGGWHVYGSLLGLDLALARHYLPRVSNSIPSGNPVLSPEDRAHLTQSVALFDPFVATDLQVEQIAGAVRRGRDRVMGLAATPGGLDEVTRQVRLSGARRNDLEWVLTRDPDRLDRFFARSELFWLGLADGSMAADLDGWGAPAYPLDGCLCLRFPAPDDFDSFSGLGGSGYLAARFVDLQLAVAEAAADLSIPASLVRDILPIAMRDLLDGTRAAHPDDMDALVRYVHDLPRTRIEDYVSSLVGGGPLRPRPLSDISGREIR